MAQKLARRAFELAGRLGDGLDMGVTSTVLGTSKAIASSLEAIAMNGNKKLLVTKGTGWVGRLRADRTLEWGEFLIRALGFDWIDWMEMQMLLKTCLSI